MNVPIRAAEVAAAWNSTRNAIAPELRRVAANIARQFHLRELNGKPWRIDFLDDHGGIYHVTRADGWQVQAGPRASIVTYAVLRAALRGGL